MLETDGPHNKFTLAPLPKCNDILCIKKFLLVYLLYNFTF